MAIDTIGSGKDFANEALWEASATGNDGEMFTGTFTSNVTFNDVAMDGVELRAAEGETPVLKGANSRINISANLEIIFRGLDLISNVGAAGQRWSRIIAGGGSWQWINCFFTLEDVASGAGTAGQFEAFQGDFTKIKFIGNVFFIDGATYVPTTARIINHSVAGGVIPIIANNTFYVKGTAPTTLNWLRIASTTVLTVWSNNAYNGGNELRQEDSSSTTNQRNNATTDATIAGDDGVVNLVVADTWVDADNKDFTLKAGSLLIDAGFDESAEAEITPDRAGSVRPQGSAFDIGAFESAAVGDPIRGRWTETGLGVRRPGHLIGRKAG